MRAKKASFTVSRDGISSHGKCAGRPEKSAEISGAVRFRLGWPWDCPFLALSGTKTPWFGPWRSVKWAEIPLKNAPKVTPKMRT